MLEELYQTGQYRPSAEGDKFDRSFLPYNPIPKDLVQPGGPTERWPISGKIGDYNKKKKGNVYDNKKLKTRHQLDMEKLGIKENDLGKIDKVNEVKYKIDRFKPIVMRPAVMRPVDYDIDIERKTDDPVWPGPSGQLDPISFPASGTNNRAIPFYAGSLASHLLMSGDLTSRFDSIAGWMQSAGFKTGVKGWHIDSDGDVEFGSGYFRGDITGASGTFSGDLSAANGSLGTITIADDGYIQMGKTSYADNTAGFWLGEDTDNAIKFHIGSSATEYLKYDGTNLSMLGGTITGATIQTGTTGYNLKLSTSILEFRTGTTRIGTLWGATGDILALDSENGLVINAGDACVINFNDGGGSDNFGIKNDGTEEFIIYDDHSAWFNDDLKADGDIQCGDTFVASNGNAGAEGSITFVYDVFSYWTGSWTDIKQTKRTLTVNDGLITNNSGGTDSTVLAHVWNG